MKTMLELTRENLNAINAAEIRSAWARGVGAYAVELMNEYADAVNNGYATGTETGAELEKKLLNGARNWNEYSEGGCALLYDGDICERLSAPWEIRKTRNGERNPNSAETWLDCQARALYQAAERVKRAARKAEKELKTA